MDGRPFHRWKISEQWVIHKCTWIDCLSINIHLRLVIQEYGPSSILFINIQTYTLIVLSLLIIGNLGLKVCNCCRCKALLDLRSIYNFPILALCLSLKVYNTRKINSNIWCEILVPRSFRPMSGKIFLEILSSRQWCLPVNPKYVIFFILHVLICTS